MDTEFSALGLAMVDSGSEDGDEDELDAAPSLDDFRQILGREGLGEDPEDEVPEFRHEEPFSWSEDFSTFAGQEEVFTQTPGPNVEETGALDLFSKIWNRTISWRKL